MAVRSVDWVTCGDDECVGVQLPSADRCWAHADGHDLDTALDRLRQGDDLDGRGVVFTAELLQRLLEAVPKDDEGRPVISTVSFSGATFEGDAWFDQATFTGDAWFDRASFTGNASFSGATFTGDPSFSGTTFTGDARFDQATLRGNALFDRATFEGNTSFSGATFTGDPSFSGTTFTGDARFDQATLRGNALFDRATFKGNALFDQATFTGNAWFDQATFTGNAWFDRATLTGNTSFHEATFKGNALFDQATFTGNAWFDRATFTGNASFSGATFTGNASFSGATFKGEAAFRGTTFQGDAAFDRAIFLGNTSFVEATFGKVAHFNETVWTMGGGFIGARFGGDAHFVTAQFADTTSFLRASFAERCNFSRAEFEGEALVLDEATFQERIAIEARVGSLSGRNTLFLAGADLRLPRVSAEYDGAAFAGPSVVSGARILSLRGARVSDLTLAGVDLSECRFAGARGVDSMRIEGDSSFPWSPGGWRWTARRVILEESAWRAKGYRAWTDPSPLTATYPPTEADPLSIADTYRGLRKAKEDSKDEPGAADFYYGEMEMRRNALQQSGPGLGGLLSFWGERIVVTAYWLVSGYGLRASRAFLALAATIALGAALLHQFGFVPHKRPEDGTLLFALESSISLLRVPEGDLTAFGHVVQIVLRLVGPLFFGLALLALRGRVKR